MSEEAKELKKIRTELQWLSWGLIKIPLVGLALYLITQLFSSSSGPANEPAHGGPATSLDEVCKETNDGRLAVEVGQRTLYIDSPAAYQKLSAEEKWKLWDADDDGTATVEEIEEGISQLQTPETE